MFSDQLNYLIIFCGLRYSSKAVYVADLTVFSDSIQIIMCVFIWWREWGRSCLGIFKERGVRVDPLESPDSAADNQLGQLAWEPVDVPSGSLNGSRRLAAPLYPHLAPLPQTTLLVCAPSSPLSPACLLLYLQTMQDSFKLCVALPQHSSCHVPLHRCDLFHHFNSCHGSFHAVSWIFVFWMIRKRWVAPARPCLSSWWGFIPSKGLARLHFEMYIEGDAGS